MKCWKRILKMFYMADQSAVTLNGWPISSDPNWPISSDLTTTLFPIRRNVAYDSLMTSQWYASIGASGAAGYETIWRDANSFRLVCHLNVRLHPGVRCIMWQDVMLERRYKYEEIAVIAEEHLIREDEERFFWVQITACRHLIMVVFFLFDGQVKLNVYITKAFNSRWIIFC